LLLDLEINVRRFGSLMGNNYNLGLALLVAECNLNVFDWVLIIYVCVHRINTGYCEAQTLIGHSNFVVCVCILPPHDGQPLGLILTGSNDHCICAFSPDSSEPLYVLKGHTNAGMCNANFFR
jgi:WD40 repeat protein